MIRCCLNVIVSSIPTVGPSHIPFDRRVRQVATTCPSTIEKLQSIRVHLLYQMLHRGIAVKLLARKRIRARMHSLGYYRRRCICLNSIHNCVRRLFHRASLCNKLAKAMDHVNIKMPSPHPAVDSKLHSQYSHSHTHTHRQREKCQYKSHSVTQ